MQVLFVQRGKPVNSKAEAHLGQRMSFANNELSSTALFSSPNVESMEVL